MIEFLFTAIIVLLAFGGMGGCGRSDGACDGHCAKHCEQHGEGDGQT